MRSLYPIEPLHFRGRFRFTGLYEVPMRRAPATATFPHPPPATNSAPPPLRSQKHTHTGALETLAVAPARYVLLGMEALPEKKVDLAAKRTCNQLLDAFLRHCQMRVASKDMAFSSCNACRKIPARSWRPQLGSQNRPSFSRPYALAPVYRSTLQFWRIVRMGRAP